MVNNNPYKAYKQQSIMTMTPGDMVTALYDAVIKELTIAKSAFLRSDIAEINRSLQKVQKILHHLQSTLDFQYAVSESLNSLYDYFLYITVQANTKKDSSQLDEVIQMVTDLRDTYSQADKQARSADVTG